MNDNTATSRTLDRRTFWLGVSAVMFTVLLAAHASRPGLVMPTASAAEVVDGRDYSLVTAAQADGNEAIYVLDKRTGFMAMVQWNISAGRPEVVDIKPIQQAFAGR